MFTSTHNLLTERLRSKVTISEIVDILPIIEVNHLTIVESRRDC